MSRSVARFEYECPACGGEMRGDFGEPVRCPNCGRCYETDWDYTNSDEGNMTAWVVREVECEQDDDVEAGNE